MTTSSGGTSRLHHLATVVPARTVLCFYLTPASPSMLGYHHDLDESFIRLLNDGQHLGQREVEEF